MFGPVIVSIHSALLIQYSYFTSDMEIKAT